MRTLRPKYWRSSISWWLKARISCLFCSSVTKKIALIPPKLHSQPRDTSHSYTSTSRRLGFHWCDLNKNSIDPNRLQSAKLYRSHKTASHLASSSLLLSPSSACLVIACKLRWWQIAKSTPQSYRRSLLYMKRTTIKHKFMRSFLPKRTNPF